MPIIATPGAIDSDSFVTLAEAEAYHANRLHNANWTAATDIDKEAALKWATRLLDKERWIGTRTSDLQALRWPRAYVEDPDGYSVDSEIIPKFLKDATSELGFLLITADRTAEAGTEGFKKIKVGSIELEIDSMDRVKSLSPAVYEMIEGYVTNGLRMERG